MADQKVKVYDGSDWVELKPDPVNVPTKTSDLENDGDGGAPFITEESLNGLSLCGSLEDVDCSSGPIDVNTAMLLKTDSDMWSPGGAGQVSMGSKPIEGWEAGSVGEAIENAGGSGGVSNLPISSTDDTVVLSDDGAGSYSISTGGTESVTVDEDGHVAINRLESSAGSSALPRANTMLEVVADTASPFPLILDGTKSTDYEGRTGIRMYNGASQNFEYFCEQDTAAYGFTGGSNARSGILYGEAYADIYVVPGTYVEIQPELHVDQIKTFNDAVGDVDLALSGKCFKVNFEGSGTQANAMAGTSWSPLMVASQQYVTGSEDPADDETGWVENWGFTIEARNRNWNNGAGSFGVGFISVVPGNDVNSAPHMVYRTSGNQGGGHIFMTAAYSSNPNDEEYTLWLDVNKKIVANKHYVPTQDNHLATRKFVTGADGNATGGYLPLAGGTMDIGGDIMMPSGRTDAAQLQVGGADDSTFRSGFNITARGAGLTGDQNNNVQVVAWAMDGARATFKLATGDGSNVDHYWNITHKMELDEDDNPTIDNLRIVSTGDVDYAAFSDHPVDGKSIRFSFDTTFLADVIGTNVLANVFTSQTGQAGDAFLKLKERALLEVAGAKYNPDTMKYDREGTFTIQNYYDGVNNIDDDTVLTLSNRSNYYGARIDFATGNASNSDVAGATVRASIEKGSATGTNPNDPDDIRDGHLNYRVWPSGGYFPRHVFYTGNGSNPSFQSLEIANNEILFRTTDADRLTINDDDIQASADYEPQTNSSLATKKYVDDHAGGGGGGSVVVGTPTSATEPNDPAGSMKVDEDFLWVKTPTAWKKLSLSAFDESATSVTVQLTQAAFDAISVPDPNVLYVIVG